jgi:succinate dehydrogenase/fumarate reductase cytochrome b subunit
MKKVYKNYSPYLTIYKPQLGNIISILERITGIFLVVLGVICLVLLYLKSSCLLTYSFYKFFFIFFKGSFFLVDIFVFFFLFNFMYHIYFLPILLKRYKSLVGEINNYHLIKYETIINYTALNVISLLLLTTIAFILIN